jgi:ribonuclease VapC
MPSPVVLDASAILALIFSEPGAEILSDEILDVAVAGTVNLAEAQTKLVKMGYAADDAWVDVLSSVSTWQPFTGEQAKIAGSLVALTQPHGLSLGDRSCLALALALKAPVYTTDRAWQGLDVGVEIRLMR